MINRNLFFLTIALSFFLILEKGHAQSAANTSNDTCQCKPSLPIEIGISAIIWGIPTSYIWRRLFLRDSTVVNAISVLLPPSLFLLMFTLGPISELTSECETSWWHTLWIGLATGVTSTLIFNAFSGGIDHPGNLKTFKYNVGDYLALGLAPSVASVFIYNLFLHPKEKKDQSMFVFPSVGNNNTASLNFIMKF